MRHLVKHSSKLGSDPEAPQGFPPGHFYSTIPSLIEVRRNEHRIFSVPSSIPGVDLNEVAQRATIEQLAHHFPNVVLVDDKSDKARFYWNNPNFGRGEAIIYAAMLRHLSPRRVIEIGCGYSTLVLLDTLDAMQSPETNCLCVEPYPELLYSLIRHEDRNRLDVHPLAVQEVELACFEALEPRDVLFIDSTHVSKVGSDLNFILFEILPRLSPGVHVHFHDIYYPFEYPKEWVFGGKNWNEAYLVRAFLQYNSAFKVVCFNSYLGQCHPDLFAETDPMFLRNHGSSLWLRRE